MLGGWLIKILVNQHSILQFYLQYDNQLAKLCIHSYNEIYSIVGKSLSKSLPILVQEIQYFYQWRGGGGGVDNSGKYMIVCIGCITKC